MKSPWYSFARTMPIPAVVCLMATSLAGCAPTSQASGGIPFSNLVSGSTPLADIGASGLFVFDSAGQAEQVASWLAPETSAALENADYKSNVIVIAFWGPNASTGYAMQIQEVSLSEKDIRVIAGLTAPDADSMQSDVITYAYHAVTIPRSALPKLSGLKWLLYDSEQNQLAETTTR